MTKWWHFQFFLWHFKNVLTAILKVLTDNIWSQNVFVWGGGGGTLTWLDVCKFSSPYVYNVFPTNLNKWTSKPWINSWGYRAETCRPVPSRNELNWNRRTSCRVTPFNHQRMQQAINGSIFDRQLKCSIRHCRRELSWIASHRKIGPYQYLPTITAASQKRNSQ